MARERLSMRKIKEILRLKFEYNFSIRKIANSCSIGRGTVADYLSRARKADLKWPLPKDITDTELETLLFQVMKYTVVFLWVKLLSLISICMEMCWNGPGRSWCCLGLVKRCLRMDRLSCQNNTFTDSKEDSRSNNGFG